MNENNLKPLPISNTENVQESKLEKLLKQYWSSIIAYLISIFGGCVVGLSTRSFHEGIIYSSIFVVESIICAIIGFPLFYLFSLPYVWFYFIKWIGWPNHAWHFLFGDGCCSLESFHDVKGNAGFTVLKGIYIGIPFCIFCLLWLIFVIACFPLIFALFAVYGFGGFGCCLHYWCLMKCESCELLFQTMNSCFYHTLCGNVYALALPMIILSIIHVILVGVTWYGIFLLVVSLIYFLAFIYFTIAPLFSTSARQIV